MTSRNRFLDKLPPKFAAFPRARLAQTPTPIEDMANLGARLGGPRLFVKRDDCTGLAFGGNKARQLEFYLGEAQARGADTVLITGAVQSNFVRMAAAGARRLGMDCHLQLEERVTGKDALYHESGNVLLDRILGATLHHYPQGEDEAGADGHLEAIAAELGARGAKPYIIPLAPGHPPLGALGYVAAAAELLGQLDETGLRIDEIVVGSGSGHTHAGLLFGLRALGSGIPVTGVCVRRSAEAQSARVAARCREIAEMLESAAVPEAGEVIVSDEVLAPGYGQLNPETCEAVLLAARCEGLLLDPVYTGKTLALLIKRARAGAWDPDAKVLFLHTGGQPALFGYGTAISACLDAAELADGNATAR